MYLEKGNAIKITRFFLDDHHTSTTNLTMNDAGSNHGDQSLTDQDQHQVGPELEGSILNPQNRSCNSSACREDQSVSYVGKFLCLFPP